MESPKLVPPRYILPLVEHELDQKKKKKKKSSAQLGSARLTKWADLGLECLCLA